MHTHNICCCQFNGLHTLQCAQFLNLVKLILSGVKQTYRGSNCRKLSFLYSTGDIVTNAIPTAKITKMDFCNVMMIS